MCNLTSLKIWSLLLAFILPACVGAQSLQIINVEHNTDISGASITIQSPDNHGWVGYESLDLSVKVINTNHSTLEIGAKKIELDTLQPDVQHTFCFAGNCYPVSTYVSPSHLTLEASGADSGFLAHYLFNNAVHVRGQNHVAYVFYDVMNPSDSVAVFVTYNTVVSVSIAEKIRNNGVVVFPNPATNMVTFQCAFQHKNARLECTNVLGEIVTSVSFPDGVNSITLPTGALPTGVYYYYIISENEKSVYGSFVVAQ